MTLGDHNHLIPFRRRTCRSALRLTHGPRYPDLSSMSRRHNFQTISWFWDLYQRGLLDLDPPYQRRSVWNQSFKDYFVDTVLLNYPAPALFLFEEIKPDGRSLYHVVDGKQRLTSLFQFIKNEFPVSEGSELTALRGRYFQALDDDPKRADEIKRSFWSYQFLVEYVPVGDEHTINAIFDRINRNVAKLTPQELRHAKLGGAFISTAEKLTEWMQDKLPKNFPRFAYQSRSQMKDVEFVALLLLLIESGARGYSQDDLDTAFTERDQVWEAQPQVEAEFRAAIDTIALILECADDERDVTASRLRNQADFYSLVGTIVELRREQRLPAAAAMMAKLTTFVRDVDNEETRVENAHLVEYFDAARSASNDKGPRERRIAILKNVLLA